MGNSVTSCDLNREDKDEDEDEDEDFTFTALYPHKTLLLSNG